MATLVYTVTLSSGGNAPTDLEAANLKAIFEKVTAEFNYIEGGAILKVDSVEEVIE